MPKVFLDTNVVVYAFTDDHRSAISEERLARGGDLSAQVLNEFTNVALRKLRFSLTQVEEALAAIRTLARAIHPLDLDTHSQALELAQHYGLSFYDALIVSAALRARCEILHSAGRAGG